MTTDAGSTTTTPRGLSRRDALKRGALVGGAVLWTVPAIQTITMTAAHAATPSAVGTLPSDLQILVQFVGLGAAPTGVLVGQCYGLKYDVASKSWGIPPTRTAEPSANRCLFGLTYTDAPLVVIALFTAGASATPVNRTSGGSTTSGISLVLPTGWAYCKETSVGGTLVESAFVHDGSIKDTVSGCSLAVADPSAPGAFYFPKPAK